MASGPSWEQIVTVSLGTICMALNSTEIVLILKKRKSIKTFELILLSFSVADLMVGLSMLASAAYDIDRGKTMDKKDPMSYFIWTTQMFAPCSSITNILGISIDRVLAVEFPLRHRIWMSRQNAKWLILVIWLASIILTLISVLPQFIILSESGKNNFLALYVLSVMIFIFGTIFIAIYSYIVWKVAIRRDEFNESDSSRHRKAARETTLVYTCVLAVLTFVGCNYPAGILSLIAASDGRQNSFYAVAFWIPALFLINSILDPFVYFFKGYLENRTRKKEVNSTNLDQAKYKDRK